MMNKHFILFIITVLILSCKNESKITKEIIGNATYIDASDKSIKFESLDEIFDITSYLSLKGISRKDYIASISKVVPYKNQYFVLDRRKSNLFVFDNKGYLLSKVGTRGMGPGEYTDIKTFDINYKTNEIYVLSAEDIALNVYTLEGEFVRKKRFDTFFPKTMALLNNEYLIFDTGYDDDYNHNVIITDTEGNVIEKNFPYPDDLLEMSFAYTGGINSSGLQPLYTDSSSSLILGFNDDLQPFRKYDLFFGSKTWNHDKRYDFELFMRENRRSNITFLTSEYVEGSDALIFSFIEDNFKKRGLYSKKTGTVLTKNNFEDQNLSHFFQMPIGLEDNNFIFYIDNDLYLELKELNPQLQNLLEDKYPKLNSHLSDVKENSEPLLIFFSLKSEI